MYNKQLETFIHVADAGSFSKAAELLYITPTAVIKQINLLEANLNLQLFARSYQGIILTSSGKSFYDDAKHIIAYSKESVIRAKNALQNTDNIVRIGTSPMTPSQFLATMWSQIHKYYPSLQFQIVSFENTPENAKDILRNLGKNIDVVAGFYDEAFLVSRQCNVFWLSNEPIRCAVSVHSDLAKKERLTYKDLYSQKIMMIKKDWNKNIDCLRNNIIKNHKQIELVDFDFYNLEIFNQCENDNNILITFDMWKNAHPLLKIIPVEWEYTSQFGIFHSKTPSIAVGKLLKGAKKVVNILKKDTLNNNDIT